MSTPDKQTSTTLFELLHKKPAQKAAPMQVPTWMKGAGTNPPPETRPAQDEAIQPGGSTPEPPVAKTPSAPGWLEWLTEPIGFRLKRSYLLAGATLGPVLVVVVFLIGMQAQKARQSSAWSDYEKQLPQINALQQQPANRGLIDKSVRRDSDIPEPDVPPPPSNARAAGSSADPRESGLNYFRLVEVKEGGVEEGKRAIAFLQSNGVDAALISVNNGRSYKLLALRGFSKVSGPDAKKYLDQIRQLGRLWKAKHKGSSDWSDAIAEKYVPGKT